jgi:glycosyltransferase involved in cell wall biosynthesis
MKRATFAVPGDLATPTGGYTYDRRVIDELRAMGWSIDVLNLGDNFPLATAEQSAEATRQLVNAPSPLIIDALAYGALPEGATTLARTHKVIALVHHPLAMEPGLSADGVEKLRASERTALAAAHRIIANSGFTARILTADYDIPADKITVAEPGTERVDWALGSSSDKVHLLAVGSVVPRKGYDTLVAALDKVSDLPWRLTIAGETKRDRNAMARLERMIDEAKLGDRIKFTGPLAHDALTAAYQFADLFVTASRLEGYGMAVADAIAYGLPLVGTRGGALADTIGEIGLVVAPNDVAELAQALRQAIGDEATRERLRLASRAAAPHLPTWRETADKIAGVIEGVA